MNTQKLNNLFFHNQVDAGAGGGAGSASGGAGAGGSNSAPAFYETFKDPDLKGYVQNKGFKDPEVLADAYRNFEKLKGVPQDRLLTLPEKLDDVAAMASVYERLGKPKSPEEYGFKGADGKTKGEFETWAEKTFHEANLSKTQAEKVLNDFKATQQRILQENARQAQEKIDASSAELKKAWGQNYDANRAVAEKAALEFGLTKEVVSALEKSADTKGVMEFLKNVGAKMSEGTFTPGDQKANDLGKMSQDGARAQIKELAKDRAFGELLAKGDAQAKARWDKLHQEAYPGHFTL